MSPGTKNPSLPALVLIFLLAGTCAASPPAAASNSVLPRVLVSNYTAFDQILRENAVFFSMLVSFSFTAAVADPAWGIDVSDISLNMITRSVRDAQGRQLIRVRVAGAVRKNNNVELNILNPRGELVGKGFFGYDSGQLTFFDRNDRPILEGFVDSGGGFILDDLRLPEGMRELASGYVDLCTWCGSWDYAWYDGLNTLIGGGRMYSSFRYNYDYTGYDSARVYWAFEEGAIKDGVAATGEAEYDLDDETTGAINSALFDQDRSAESFFANPYGLVPEPAGKALLPRFTDATGVAVTNTSGLEIDVTYVARHPDGSLVYGDGIRNPVTYSFAKGQQFAAYPAEIFRALNPQDHRPILATGEVGWMEIYSDEGAIQAMYLDSSSDGSGLGGNAGAVAGGSPVVFTDLHLDAGESTEIELLNLAYEDVVVRLQLLDHDGAVLDEESEFFIAGYGMRNFYVGAGSDFLRIADPSLAASLRVSCNNSNSLKLSGCSSIVGLATFTDSFGSLASAYAVSGADAASVLVGPYFVAGASGHGRWETAAHVTKLDGSQASVYLDLFDPGGNLLLTFSKTLGQGGTAEFLLNDSTLPFSGRLTTGYVRVRSDAGRVAGHVSFRWSDGNGSQFDEYPLAGRLSSSLQFNQVAEGSAGSTGYWTGIALMNDLDKSVRLTLRVYRPDGTEDRSIEVGLDPHGQRAALLSEWLRDPLYSRVDGYIRITSTDPVSATVLYGDSSGRFLAAVPGMPF